MSRRKPKPDLNIEWGQRPKVQLVCTDKGAHKRTHLGWCDVSRADERPQVGNVPSEGDWLFFTVDKYGSAGSGLETWGRQAIDTETGEVFEGGDRHDDLLQHVRQRYTPTRLCDRCTRDVQFTEARLIAIVRHAQDTGQLRVDVSRFR